LSSDPEYRKELDKERYYREYLEDTFGELYIKIEEKTQKLFAVEAEVAAKKTEIAAKDTEIAAKDARIDEETQRRLASEAELAAKDIELAELRKRLGLS
jgi:thioredoxin-related protein